MIVYHGMPSGLTIPDEIRVFRGKHLFVSYGTTPEALEHYASFAASVAVDNGAFSAWKSGAVFDYTAFYVWLRAVLDLPNVDWFVAPDSVDGGEEENDRLLGAVPADLCRFAVPVWHMHESFERLTRLCADWPRIALGSSGQFKRPCTASWWARMEEAWKHIPAKVRVHGLRMLDPRCVSRMPLSSADSTTAGRNSNMNSRFAEGSPLKRCRARTRVDAYCQTLEWYCAPPRWGLCVPHNEDAFSTETVESECATS